jgi:hypothetical protein
VDKVRRPRFGFQYDDDPAVERRIIDPTVAHICINNVTGAREPFSNQRTLVWRQ